jgi:methionine-rich copper-binding protein CopC
MLLSLVLSASAVAHPKLTKSEPAADAVLDAAPKIISVTFNEPLEGAFSTITLKRADGAAVVTQPAKVDPATPLELVLQAPALTAGEYVAHYAVIGHDGHRREGDLKFTVK